MRVVYKTQTFNLFVSGNSADDYVVCSYLRMIKSGQLIVDMKEKLLVKSFHHVQMSQWMSSSGVSWRLSRRDLCLRGRFIEASLSNLRVSRDCSPYAIHIIKCTANFFGSPTCWVTLIRMSSLFQGSLEDSMTPSALGGQGGLERQHGFASHSVGSLHRKKMPPQVRILVPLQQGEIFILSWL